MIFGTHISLLSDRRTYEIVFGRKGYDSFALCLRRANRDMFRVDMVPARVADFVK